MGHVIDTKLNKMLLALLGSQSFVDTWWNSPNIVFGLKTPRDMYYKNPRRVADYLGVHIAAEGS